MYREEIEFVVILLSLITFLLTGILIVLIEIVKKRKP